VRETFPRPFLLSLVLLLVVGAAVAIELRAGRAGPQDVAVVTTPSTPGREDVAAPDIDEPVAEERGEPAKPELEARSANPAEERIGRKGAEFERAREIVSPSGFINSDGVSIREARGEKVVLIDFWTYACYNCQNTQPHLNAWHEEYADDGLMIVGVHSPEFAFEADPANVERAVRDAGIEYPVVLDNDHATWDAYDQRFWPTMYLVDADGFVRYQRIGEGAYEETEAKIRELLSEKDRLKEAG
jgi:thiol-disulfide isomerase/thioredoxin